jgi:DNA transposition AAA+ family ATPase
MSCDVSFIETSVYHRIEDVATRVVDLGWTAVITGAPGVGKTRAIREFANR